MPLKPVSLASGQPGRVPCMHLRDRRRVGWSALSSGGQMGGEACVHASRGGGGDRAGQAGAGWLSWEACKPGRQAVPGGPGQCGQYGGKGGAAAGSTMGTMSGTICMQLLYTVIGASMSAWSACFQADRQLRDAIITASHCNTQQPFGASNRKSGFDGHAHRVPNTLLVWAQTHVCPHGRMGLIVMHTGCPNGQTHG